MSAVEACLIETGRFCLCCGPLCILKKSSRTLDSSLDAQEDGCSVQFQRDDSQTMMSLKRSNSSKSIKLNLLLGMTVRSSGWGTWAKNDFLSSSAQLCKVYLKVHQKVKSIFILWDSLSFWPEQPREQIGFCLVWVKGVLQPSYFQSEDWALILGCYKTGNAQARFSNIKVFNLKVVFLSYSTIALSPLPWAVLASFL